MEVKKKRKMRLAIYVVVYVAILIAVGFFMQFRMRQLLYHFMEIQVTNQAKGLAEQIKIRLDVELRNLEELSAGITLAEKNEEDFVAESGVYLFPRSVDGMTAGLLTLDGRALYGDELDFSAFSGIQDAFRGNSSVSFCKEDGLLFTVPVYRGKNVRYVLYRLYTSDMLTTGFFEDAFSGMSDIAVVDIGDQEIVPFREREMSAFTSGKNFAAYQSLQEKMNIASASSVFVQGAGSGTFMFMAEVTGYGMYLMGNVPEVVLSEGVLSLIALVLWVFALLILLMVIGAAYLINVESRARESDDLRLAKQIAEEANTAKSNFLAQMSHEIRTPINAVLGMNEMILKESKDDTVTKYAANAYSAGNALLSIINDILDISKIEAGKLEIVNEDYDLYSLVSDCYNMTAARAEKKGLEFTYSVDEKLPKKMKGDMFHIRQIVVNFITNAIKYTDEGSVDLVFTGKKKENLFSLQISVRDTGIGLTKESQEHLFESFRRFDLKRNQSVEGTGLGLSICKQLAELMGGNVRAESVYGKGSTFICEIPQQIISDEPIGKLNLDITAEVINVTEQNRFVAPGARILVVDDVETNLLVFTSLLKEHKMRIDTALSGKKCLDLLTDNTYDIIFLDHMMPGMDGMETFAKMKESNLVTPDTPVVMLTANAISGEREKYLSAGFTSYLTKPIKSEKLNHLLLQYLPKELIEMVNGNEHTEAGKVLTEPHVAEAGKALTEMHTAETDRTPTEAYAAGTDRAPAESYAAGTDENTGLIDMKLGLSYAGDSEESYVLILGSYVKNGDRNIGKIKALFGEENWKDYIISIHALKSTSLTIGAKELSILAEGIESAGKNENYALIREKNGELLKSYKDVLDEGRKMIDDFASNHGKSAYANDGSKGERSSARASENSEEAADTSGSFKEITAEKLLEIREHLRKACMEFSSEEIDSVMEEVSLYTYQGIRLSAKLIKVKELADDFEYMDAGELAEKIFDEM